MTHRLGTLELGGRPRIVAAGGEHEIDALGVTKAADVIELRADLFTAPAPEGIVAALVRLRAAARPLLLTVRAASEGGRGGTDAHRAAIYEACLAHADAIDVEIASQALAERLVPLARARGRTVILSAHFLDSTPAAERLLALVDQGFASGADLVKLATWAHTLEDVRTLLSVTLAARARGVVTMAMGPVGTISRVIFPAAGSLLTYGCVGAPTAPGQLPVEELARDIERFYTA